MKFLMMYPVKGYASLTDQQRELFERVYLRHMKAFGTEKRQDYAPEKLKEVKWDAKENCLKVYFKNGDWWHYDTKGEWY